MEMKARRSYDVVLAAIAALCIVVTASLALMFYAVSATDRITAAREDRLLHRAIDRKLAKAVADVSSASIWDDAYANTAQRPDAEWMHVNYGVYYHDYMDHDVTLAFDGEDRVIYQSLEGEPALPRRTTAFAAAARPLVAKARALGAAKILADPAALGFERAGSASAVIQAGGKVYLAAACAVVPEKDSPLQAVGRDPIVVSAIELDPAFLRDLEAEYGLAGLKLARTPPRIGAWLPLKAMDGATLGGIAWTPERPGIGVYRDAQWTILALGIVVTLLIGGVIWRVQRMAAELMKARDQAQAADRAKSEFLANMSHEIRTPLNGVLGMAQAMAAEELNPAQRERLDIIRKSGSTLLAVLNDVLDISKIQAGKLEILDAPFDAPELAHTVCATFEGLAAAKDIALRLEVAEGLAPRWIGDATRVRQILFNLVSNGLKFTEHGSVVLSVSAGDDGLRFSVTDTGIGLDPTQLSRLFQKFAQGDATTTRRYGGTGLGLSISRELAELMGGRLEAASEPGKGACFILTLPFSQAGDCPAKAAAEAAAKAPAGEREETLRVLAAEDNPTNQVVLRSLMAPLGADLTIVGDGQAAVQAFTEGAFDIVLMDVQMPVMNGVDATAAIRAFEQRAGQPRTPILGVSANVMAHQIAEYMAAGMDGYVAKPIEIGALYAALEKALGDAEATPAEEADAA